MAENGPGGGVFKTIDRVSELLKTVNSLTGDTVLVGVPRENDKKGRGDSPIGNAMLARVHEYGSPAHNIPARPFLQPGVKAIQKEAVAMLADGARAAIKNLGQAVNVDAILNKVGILARNSVVRAITDPEPAFVPLKPATIRARLRRTAGGRRKLRDLGRIKTAAGWSGAQSGQALEEWAEAGNIHPLIDSGALRASIGYVIRETD